MYNPTRLAIVIKSNIEALKSDITFDEVVEIARFYVKLHNRLYKDLWNEEEYLAEFISVFLQKRAE